MEIGKAGENLFSHIMKQNGYGVEDVSGNPNYWYKDIDFIITSPFTNAVKTFEVKYDSRIANTNNLYLEIWNRNSKAVKGLGWWRFCEADYLAYGDFHNNIFYVFKVEELKNRVESLNLSTRCCGSDSQGIIISLDQVKDLYQVISL